MCSESGVSWVRAGFIAGMALVLVCCQDPGIDIYSEMDALPRIDPDYSGVVIPPNIAPLNFLIEEEGSEYFVEIYGSKREELVRVRTRENVVEIEPGQWKDILASNVGGELLLDVYVKDESGKWSRFRSIVNRIAEEEIDRFVAYRLINPGYVLWWEMGIYQRNLENFTESTVFSNRSTQRNCMNCHAFCWNDPRQMMFHMRAGYGGTILVLGGEIKKIDTSTEYTMSAGVYPAWHPGGGHIAFSVNKIVQAFHNHPDRSIHVRDTASDLIIYDIKRNVVTTSPKVSTRQLENLPAWSPDGQCLYFCRGPERQGEMKYSEYRYDLARIRCSVEENQWGEVELVIPADELGRSISFPRISPDGAYLLFSGSEYGYFSIHFASSDLYMMDLRTKKYGKLEINSDDSDSYHSWSSNSRWIVFASKRRGGLCSRLYFSYVDSAGKAHKPFLLPQEDPTFYDTFIRNYNVPEMITDAVPVGHWDLMRAARGAPQKAEFDQTVDVDALSGATRIRRDQ